MSEPFGGMQFSHSLLLVLCNRLTTCLISLIIIAVGPPTPDGSVLQAMAAHPTCRSAGFRGSEFGFTYR